MYDDFKNIQTVELKRKEYAARVALDDADIALRQSWEMEETRDHARRQLVMTLRASIYGKDHPKKHIIRYPETWWEAVKERFAPSWLRDLYPVRFVEVSASLEELYPGIEPALPNKTPVMKFHVLKQIERPIW